MIELLFFLRMFLKWFRHWSSTKAQSLFISALLGCNIVAKDKLFPVVQPSLTFRYTSVSKSEAAYVIRRLTSRCLERKQPSRVGESPLRDLVSSFLCHTHIQTEKISSWNGPTVHVCCFMLARASTKTFVSRIHMLAESKKQRKKIFVSRKIRQQGHSLAEVSLYNVTSWRVRVTSFQVNAEKSSLYIVDVRDAINNAMDIRSVVMETATRSVYGRATYVAASSMTHTWLLEWSDGHFCWIFVESPPPNIKFS